MKTHHKYKKGSLSVSVLFLIVFPFLSGQSHYLLTLLIMCCIYGIAAIALNLLIGYGGQISVGNAAFLTVGGYAAGVLATKFGLPMILVLPLSGVISAFTGLIIGIPAIRLNGHFLAVATLGFALSVPQIAFNWDSVTGGYNGLAIPRPALLSNNLSLYYVIAGIVLLMIWGMYNILRSRIGRAFTAVRESEVAAQAIGVNVSYYKTMMFVISAFFTGIAGAIYSYWVGFVSPTDFTLMTSLLLLAMIVVGGLASIPGSMIGAVLLTIIPHFTDKFIGITNIVIGIAIVLILFYRPEGIVSLFRMNARKTSEKDNADQTANYQKVRKHNA